MYLQLVTIIWTTLGLRVHTIQLFQSKKWKKKPVAYTNYQKYIVINLKNLCVFSLIKCNGHTKVWVSQKSYYHKDMKSVVKLINILNKKLLVVTCITIIFGKFWNKSTKKHIKQIEISISKLKYEISLKSFNKMCSILISKPTDRR